MACGNSVLWRIPNVLPHRTGCRPGPKVTGPAQKQHPNETGLATATLRALAGGQVDRADVVDSCACGQVDCLGNGAVNLPLRGGPSGPARRGAEPSQATRPSTPISSPYLKHAYLLSPWEMADCTASNRRCARSSAAACSAAVTTTASTYGGALVCSVVLGMSQAAVWISGGRRASASPARRRRH